MATSIRLRTLLFYHTFPMNANPNFFLFIFSGFLEYGRFLKCFLVKSVQVLYNITHITGERQVRAAW